MAHFTSNCESLLSFIVHIIAQPFFKLRMPRFLAAKFSTITILLCKSHFVFLSQSRIQLLITSYILPATLFPMFSASSIPKLFFCREQVITRSCSHSLLHSLMRNRIICLEASGTNVASNNACTPVFLW